MTTVRVVDTSDAAEKMYLTFNDRAHRRKSDMPFSWPSRMHEIGRGKAVMYRSNKWKRDRTEFEDYKHVAEAWQTAYVTPGFLVEWANPGKHIKVTGPMVSMQEPMPKHFARLAPLLGVQVQLSGYPKDEGFFEVVIAHGMLGGAEHPKTGEKFVFVYTNRHGVHMMFTGPELDVEQDGIVG